MRKNFPLRIDETLFDAVRKWADDELRSTNGQIEFLLRDALKRAGRLPRPKAAAELCDDGDANQAGELPSEGM